MKEVLGHLDIQVVEAVVHMDMQVLAGREALVHIGFEVLVHKLEFELVGHGYRV